MTDWDGANGLYDDGPITEEFMLLGRAVHKATVATIGPPLWAEPGMWPTKTTSVEEALKIWPTVTTT